SSESFVLDSNAAGDQTAPSIAALADGRFVVTWQSPSIDGNGLGIAAQVFDPLHYAGTSSGDYWWGGEFDDSIAGSDGLDTLGGAGGADTINGDAGNDLIFAEAGNDSIHGGADNDELNGGAGLDHIYGDEGD